MNAKLEIKGEIAEDYLYEFVNAHSGLSIYELSKRLGWSMGKVYNIIKVLEDDGLVRTIKTEEGGRIKRKVYPVDWKDRNCSKSGGFRAIECKMQNAN